MFPGKDPTVNAIDGLSILYFYTLFKASSCKKFASGKKTPASPEGEAGAERMEINRWRSDGSGEWREQPWEG